LGGVWGRSSGFGLEYLRSMSSETAEVGTVRAVNFGRMLALVECGGVGLF
jgi:hypothetical protein